LRSGLGVSMNSPSGPELTVVALLFGLLLILCNYIQCPLMLWVCFGGQKCWYGLKRGPCKSREMRNRIGTL
jgi:hypothetical protein